MTTRNYIDEANRLVMGDGVTAVRTANGWEAESRAARAAGHHARADHIDTAVAIVYRVINGADEE